MLKSPPLMLTFEEIKALTYSQVVVLIEETQSIHKERIDEINRRTQKHGKNLFVMMDITRDLYNG